MEGFPERIKQLRTAKRMSQAELGDVVGVTRAAVQQWEKGATVPTLLNLTELARFFSISLAELTGSPSEQLSIDAELRQLPPDVAMLLRQSFLNTIRGLRPLK